MIRKVRDGIIAKIEEAIKKKELKAFFQPQYDALTGKIVGAEALVRWIKDLRRQTTLLSIHQLMMCL